MNVTASADINIDSIDLDFDIDADDIISEGEAEIRHIVQDELGDLDITANIRAALLDINLLEIINQQQQHHEKRAESLAEQNATLCQEMERAKAHYGTSEDAWESMVMAPAETATTRTSPNGPAPDRF